MLNNDLLYYVAEFIEPNPAIFCKLAEVNKNFYQVFTSNRVWRRNNIYKLSESVYKHFLGSLSILDKKLLPAYCERYCEGPEMFINKPLRDITKVTPNKYVWLACYLYPQYRSTAPRVYPDCEELMELIGPMLPHIWFAAPSDSLLDNWNAAYQFLRSPHSTSVHGYLFESTILSYSIDFCLEVIAGRQDYASHPLHYFPAHIQSDPRVLEIASETCPEIVLLAEPSPYIINKYLPTEEIFTKAIAGKPDRLIPYLDIYNSCEVILVAVDDLVSPQLLELWDRLEARHLQDKRIASAMVRSHPTLINRVSEHLLSDRDFVHNFLKLDTRVCCEDYELNTILPLVDPLLLKDKDIMYAMCLKLVNKDDFYDAQNWCPGHCAFSEVINDPVFAKNLLDRNHFWFLLIPTPILRTLIPRFVQKWRGRVAMEYSLDAELLRDKKILEIGAQTFKNILEAPVELLTPDIVRKNAQWGGVLYTSLPDKYYDDRDFFYDLVTTSIHGFVRGFSQFHRHFSKKARASKKILRYIYEHRDEITHIPGYSRFGMDSSQPWEDLHNLWISFEATRTILMDSAIPEIGPEEFTDVLGRIDLMVMKHKS